MKEQMYPEGIDCVWIASDRAGCVAAFVTAGMGPIPYEVFYGAIELQDIEEQVCQLPDVSSARRLIELELPNDYVDMASKGFFVYDWQDIHRAEVNCSRAYEPITRPSNPISVVELPSPLRSVVEGVKFRKVLFADGGNIAVVDEFQTYQSSM
ncbi:hypothetical protein [Dyella choica]|uniref:Uncharacterized protein n=1 Tax=Dyella choica TaxID=1927959 RepID=A0A432M3S9_9GAMM|nr:hypothetical protein [Dyella choica]RUL73605.1 hypothetical protein EKH80_14890 [Dyella choica]